MLAFLPLAPAALAWDRGVEARKALREADRLYNRHDYGKALGRYRDYLRARGPVSRDLETDAHAYSQLGECAEKAGVYKEATAAWSAALALRLAASDRPGIAATMRRFSESLAYRGDYRESRRVLGLAHEALQGKATARDRAEFLRILSLVEGALGDYRSQAAAAEESVSLYRGLSDDAGLAASLDVLAMVQTSQGEFQQAQASCDEALAAARRTPTPDVAPIFLTLARLDRARGNLRGALEADEQALAAARLSGVSEALAVAEANLGLDRMAFGEYAEATLALESALARFERAGAIDDQARMHLELGRAAHLQRLDTQALEQLALARDLYARSAQPLGNAVTDAARGLVLQARGDAAGALAAHESALAAFQAAGDTLGASSEAVERGFALASLGRHEEALREFGAVLTPVRPGERSPGTAPVLPDVTWRALQGRARVMAARGDLEGAARAYDEAAAAVEALDVRCRIPEFRSSFLGGSDRLSVHDEAIALLAGHGRSAQALEFAERERARAFLDLVSFHRPDMKSDVSSGLLEEDRRLSERIAWLSRAATAGAGGPVSEGLEGALRAGIGTAERELTGLREQRHRLLERIAAQSPGLASLVSVPRVPVAKLLAALPAGRPVLVYHLGEREARVFLLDAGTVVTARLPVSTKELRGKAEVFRIQLEEGIPCESMARELYSLLLGPVEARLRSGRLIVLAHDALHYVPFQALTDRRGRPLIERHAISYAPSLSALAELSARQLPGRPDGLLAICAPSAGPSLPALPNATAEVRAVAAHFVAPVVLEGAAATEEAVLRAAPAAGVLHFACHALMTPDLPMFSGLVLAPSGSTDGRLELHELFGLRLRCSLAVLSACQTASGRLSRGDELVCLARSFLQAGAPSVLASLWSVPDRSTALLMGRFYEALFRGLPRDEALAEAARAIASDADFREPYYWAAFCLFGAS